MLKPDIKTIMALQDIMVWNMVYQKVRVQILNNTLKKGSIYPGRSYMEYIIAKIYDVSQDMRKIRNYTIHKSSNT